MPITIVVPTIREESLARFLELWRSEFYEHRVIIVEDNPEATFRTPEWVEHYSWKDVDRVLGQDSWIIPRRTDCVRSFGYYLAYLKPTEFVVTLDDDCYPEATYEGGYLSEMRLALETQWADDRWYNTLGPDPVYPRGYPYDIRERLQSTAIHHGMWSNVPDLDARTQSRLPDYRTPPFRSIARVPTGRYFPMCGMNLAFRREVIPLMYFMLMGKDRYERPWPVDRFGDIWSGLMAKRVLDHLGWAVSSGAPSVHHSRASNVETNLLKETPAYPFNEQLWRAVSSTPLHADTATGCYFELADGLAMYGPYWTELRKAMRIWASLFESVDSIHANGDREDSQTWQAKLHKVRP
jgi:hypothetical protein